MDLATLLELCKAYDELGWSVQAQLHNVVDGEDLEDQNSNALKLIKDFLRQAGRNGVEDATEEHERVDAYLKLEDAA